MPSFKVLLPIYMRIPQSFFKPEITQFCHMPQGKEIYNSDSAQQAQAQAKLNAYVACIDKCKVAATCASVE